MTKYNQAFKQQVVEHYFSGYDGYRNTGKHFALDFATVRKWVAVFQQQGIDERDQYAYGWSLQEERGQRLSLMC